MKIELGTAEIALVSYRVLGRKDECMAGIGFINSLLRDSIVTS